MDHFVRPEIAAMESYTPIVPFEVLSTQLGRPVEAIVKLDANENPYGPSPAVRAALAGGRFYHIYPDPESTNLRSALSRFTGLPVEYLIAGMGADELIDLVLRAVLQPGDGVIDCPPSFGMYPFSTAVNSGRYLQVRRDKQFKLNLNGIERIVAQEPRAKVLFLCSPNNPDGSVIGDAALRRLLQLPLLVVLDEAYIEFADQPSRISWVAEYENLVVLRTFSKLAGLAGLRVGYGAFPAWLRPHLWKIKQPYNVNVAANLAALAALEDQEWLMEKVSLLKLERERLILELAKFEFMQPFPSQSNFVLSRVHGRDAHALKAHLASQGILVRYFAKPGVDNCIRISAGRPEDSDILLQALQRTPFAEIGDR